MLGRTKWFGQGQSTTAVEAAQPLPVTVLSADAKKFGLENFGNTCYANSVIQALYFCAPFRDLLIQETDPSFVEEPIAQAPLPPAPVATPTAPARRRPERTASTYADANGAIPHPLTPSIPSNPPTLFSALRSLFVYIATNPAEKGTIAPRAFIDKLKEFNELFRSTMHQDAHEFLNYLLNKIVEEIEADRRAGESGRETPQPGEELSRSIATLASNQGNSGTSPQNATLVHKLFEGVLTSETRCLTCENVSSRDESFLDLSIDIEQNASVTACLRQFSASEMLCQKNKFFCDVCCDLQEAEKRMKIKKLPNILALHLKRFKYQEDVQKYIKLAYRVAFPFELRLFNTVDDMDDADRLFNLFGIVIHIGNGPHHGHYISIIKTMGSWLVFDDENVYAITEADIPKYFGESNSGSAYVLYYQAVDIDLPTLGLRLPPVTIPTVPTETSPHLDASPSPSPAINPPLPPGLVEEADLSDISDPVIPVTPPSPQDPRLPMEIPISAEVEDVASVSSPSKGKNLFSIRRTPSVSTRPSTSSAAETRRSTADRSLQSNGAYHAAPSDDDTKPLIPPAVPPPHPPLPSEKDKDKRHEPARKASTWFGKRKSFRSGDKSATDEVPASPVLSSRGADTVSQASSSTWFLTSNHHPSEKKSRRPSEPGPSFSNGSKTISAAATRPKSTGGGLSPKYEQENGMNGYESHSPGSASSSFVSVAGSAAASHAAHSVVEFPPPRTSSFASPPLPPPPLPEPPSSPLSKKLSLHKKSMSNLSSPRDKTKTRTLPSVDPVPRPSTAGASTGAPDASPPRPLPPLPPHKVIPDAAPPVRLAQILNGEAPHTGDGPVDPFDKDKTRSEAGDTMTDETSPDVLPPTSPVGLSVLVGANNSGSSTTSSGASTNVKRASRKMSLTSPLAGLGFGKKDRNKDKEKSPSSFSFGKP